MQKNSRKRVSTSIKGFPSDDSCFLSSPRGCWTHARVASKEAGFIYERHLIDSSVRIWLS
ncbi:MAG: hypothetical protein CM1200mP4_3160 [Rhodospirillaceae bacterium]|nr:MAG: hypothetical protein CM1200mP4_3160 [Rhodospirillaceae bacterium]